MGKCQGSSLHLCNKRHQGWMIRRLKATGHYKNHNSLLKFHMGTPLTEERLSPQKEAPATPEQEYIARTQPVLLQQSPRPCNWATTQRGKGKPVKESQCRPLVFWNKDMPSVAENYMPSEKYFFKYYWASMQIRHLTMRHQVAM